MNLINLKQARINLNKTQSEIAKDLHLNQNTYSNYEVGNTEPNIAILTKLANYFNVSIDYLVGRNWQNEIGYLTPEQKECVNLLKQLNSDNLIKTSGFISALISTQSK